MDGANCWSVYIHETPSGKKYVGVTSVEPSKRWSYGYGYRHNEHFCLAIKKYGWHNISHTIVAQNLSKEDALEMEIELIKKHRSYDRRYGYNKSKGGEKTTLGYHFSDDQKKKISIATKKLWENEDFRRRVSETLKLHGIKPPSRKGAVSEKRKKVFQFTLDGEFVAEHPSVYHAACALGVTTMAISNACNGKTKTSCGYKFSFERNVNLNEEG